ncbi:MAG: TolC family protein [Nostoc sp.]|uniref:TolC family protein n=1 Tax=Nostoc sp. TaxID=1180 RepID=UPI002FF7DF47
MILIMRMQPYYFWIFNLLVLSLLSSCSQQQKTSSGVPSDAPKDTGSQPQQNTLSLPTLALTPSFQQNTGSQSQQNTLSLPTFGVTPSPQQLMGSQPQQIAQGFPNAVVASSPQQLMEIQPPKNVPSFAIFQPPVEKSQSLASLRDFSPDSNSDTQTGQQKSEQSTVATTKQLQSSQPNPVQQQYQAKNLLNESSSLVQTDKEQTNPNAILRLSLKEAFERADARNPQLLADQYNIKISAAGIKIAGAIPNPQIGFEYGFGPLYSQAANPQQVSINQTVELGGKRSKRLSVAKSQYDLAILQYNSNRFDIRGQVRRAYAELAAAQASERSQQEQVELLQRLVYISRKRFEAGAAPEAELLQAQLVLNQTEPQLGQSRGRIQQARIQLNALMGDSPTQNIEITDPGIFNVAVKKTEIVPIANAPLPTIDNLLVQAYEQRLDFKSAQQQTKVAKEQLRLAKAMRIPDLQLSGGYQFTTANTPNSNTNGIFLGVGANLPIFYNQQGEVAQAQVTVDQSIQQESVVRSQIAVDVHTAYEALIIAREKIRKYQSKLLPDSREVLALAQESYQVGKTNLASALAVEQGDQQNRSAYVDAVTAYQSAYADLEKAVGTPLSF